MARQRFVISYRWVLAALALAAIITQLVHTRQANPPGSLVNFFSFFTIEANIIAIVAFIVGAIPGRQFTAPWYDLLRGAAATYMSVTGLVYATLLSSLPAAVDSTIPWVNEVLHYLMPLVVFLDWLFVAPTGPIKLRNALIWAAFPVAYAIYSLIRGSIVHWYPYPFLNIDMHGFGRVIVNCVGIGIGALVFVVAIAWLGNAMRNGRKPMSEAPPPENEPQPQENAAPAPENAGVTAETTVETTQTGT